MEKENKIGLFKRVAFGKLNAGETIPSPGLASAEICAKL